MRVQLHPQDREKLERLHYRIFLMKRDMNELARRYQELQNKLAQEEEEAGQELLAILRKEYEVGEGQARPQFGPDYRLMFVEIPDDWKRKRTKKKGTRRESG